MNRRFLPIAALALALLLGACGGTAGNYFAPTAAVVEGVKIPEIRVKRQLAQLLSDPSLAGQFQGREGLPLRQQAEREILVRMIRGEVIAHAAGGVGVGVTSEEIESRLDQVKSQFESEQAFRAELRRRALSLAEIETAIRDELLGRRVVEAVTRDVTVPEEQIAAYYEENRGQFDGQVRAAHVLICAQFDANARACTHTPEDEAQARSVAERARAGEDFAGLALQFSRDTGTSQKGGDLGWFGGGQLVPEFEQAALALEPGQVSDPVRTRFGFHVIKLAAKGRPLAEAREEIVQAVGEAPRQQAFDAWLRQAFAGASVRVSPKYGRFDPGSLTIMPPRGEGSSEASPK